MAVAVAVAVAVVEEVVVGDSCEGLAQTVPVWV